MIFNEHRSKPMDIPRKLKHHYQDNLYGNSNFRTLIGDNRNYPRDLPDETTSGNMNRNAVGKWGLSWSVRSYGRDGKKPGHTELDHGVKIAEVITSGMIDEELDEGELADTEDTHECVGRRPRTAWCKKRHKRKPNAIALARSEVVTDTEV